MYKETYKIPNIESSGSCQDIPTVASDIKYM